MKEAFIRLLNKWACMHQWERFSTTHVHDSWGGNHTRERFVCTKCGKMKKLEPA